MKLHLPKGLRTALLAVVAIGSTVYTAQAAPAVYDYEVAVTPDRLHHTNSGPAITMLSFYLSPDMTQSWVVSFAPQSIWGAPCVDNSQYSGGCVVVGNIEVPYKSTQIKKGDVRTPAGMNETDFAVYFCPNGNIYSLSKSGRKQLLGTDPKGSASLNTGITPFQITLNWVVNEDGTGSLYYVGGSSATVTADGHIVNGDTSNFTSDKVTILENVECTEANLASIGNLFTSSSALASLRHELDITANYYQKGSGDSPARWEITGKADLAKLTAGEYLDNTTTGEGVGTGRALVVRTEEVAGDSIYFLGDSGVVYTETDATLSNNTVAEVDVLNGGTSCSVGFGAAADATLTVERTALVNSVLGEVPRGIRIVGDGTVKLVADDSAATEAAKFHVKSIDANSTLHIQSTQGSRIYLTEGTVGANADIVHTGDSTATVYIQDDGKAGASVSLNSIDVQGGHLTVTGFIPAQDATGTPSYAKFNANELKAASVYIEADSVIGSISTTADQDYTGGVIVVGSIDSETGNVNVNGAGVTALSVAAGGSVSVSSSLNAETIDAGGGMAVTETGSVSADDITVAESLTVNGMLVAQNVSAASLQNDSIVIEAGVSAHARTTTPLLSGNVKVTDTSVQADVIAGGSSVDIAAGDGAYLAAGSMEDVTVAVDGTEILTGASTSDAIRISTSRTNEAGEVLQAGSVTAGELTAEKLVIQDGYSVSVDKLTAEKITAGVATYTDAEITNAEISETEITADRIVADEVVIGDGYTVNKAAIDAKTSLSDGVVLNDVKFLGAMVTQGDLQLTNTEFQGMGSTFGGENGIAYKVDPDKQGIGSVVLNGTIKGSNLDISHMVLNGEALEFAPGAGTVTYDIITQQGDNTLTYKGKTAMDEVEASDYELYIQPYVVANVEVKDGVVKIAGKEAEREIKSGLSATENTAATIKAIDSPEQEMEAGSALSELNAYIGHVHRYSQEERQTVVEALSGASLTALADSQRRGVLDVQDNLRNRIIQMGGGTNAGLTTDWEYAGIQAWAQADGSFSTSDGSGDECGYDYDTWGATVGANLDLTANTVVGMSFSVSYGEIKSDGADRASGNNDAQYISFFARHQKDRWVQMLILTAGMNDMDMERSVLGYKANGETEGTTLSAYYELGYTFGLNYEFTHILQPIVSVSMTSAKVDGYTEDGSIGNAGLTYDGDSYFYGTVGIGARYQGVLYETVHERNAVVEARALITQDFGDTTETAKVALGNSDMYEVSGTDSSGTGFELGAGVSIPVEQHTTFYADVDMTIRPDTTGFRGNIGVRYDF